MKGGRQRDKIDVDAHSGMNYDSSRKEKFLNGRDKPAKCRGLMVTLEINAPLAHNSWVICGCCSINGGIMVMGLFGQQVGQYRHPSLKRFWCPATGSHATGVVARERWVNPGCGRTERRREKVHSEHRGTRAGCHLSLLDFTEECRNGNSCWTVCASVFARFT